MIKIGHIENEESLSNILDSLEFSKNEFDTYYYTKRDVNKEESVFYFFWELLAYIPINDKILSKRLKLAVADDSIDIVLDGIRIGCLNYRQHGSCVLDYPTHWFNVEKNKDINYILKLLVKYSLKNGLKIENLNKVLSRKIIY